MRFFAPLTTFGLVLLALTAAAAAAPPGERLVDRVAAAYAATEQYKATVRFSFERTEGRWTKAEITEVPVAFDRPSRRVAIDHPAYRLVVADRLRVSAAGAPNRHLERDVPQVLDYAALSLAVPQLIDPPMPAAAFLLSRDPLSDLTRGAVASATPLPPEADDPRQRPRLAFTANERDWTLWIDPETHLLDRVEIALPADSGKAGTRYVYEYRVEKHNQPLDEGVFDFSTDGSTAVSSLQQLMNPAAGGNARFTSPLEGKDVRKLELTRPDGSTFTLAEVDEPVVVLEFWTTWCPPCRGSLQQMEEIASWAEEKGRAVAFFAVNANEPLDLVQKFWTQSSHDVPLALDPTGDAAQEVGQNVLPHIVIIADGKIHYVQPGLLIDGGKTIRGEVDAALEKVGNAGNRTGSQD